MVSFGGVSQLLPQLSVPLFRFSLVGLFASFLANELVEGHYLALLLDIDQLVAELVQAVNINRAVVRHLPLDNFVSDSIQDFLQGFSDEVEQDAVSICRQSFLYKVELLDGQNFSFMDRATILEEGGFLHNSSAVIDEDNVQHINEILHQVYMLFKFMGGSHFLAVEVSCCNSIDADATFDLSK
jgi:hypothetical protein